TWSARSSSPRSPISRARPSPRASTAWFATGARPHSSPTSMSERSMVVSARGCTCSRRPRESRSSSTPRPNRTGLPVPRRSEGGAVKNAKLGPARATGLRRRAEARVSERKMADRTKLPADEIQRLFHELQVHQVELEMQNEELRQARLETEAGLARYARLFD